MNWILQHIYRQPLNHKLTNSPHQGAAVAVLCAFLLTAACSSDIAPLETASSDVDLSVAAAKAPDSAQKPIATAALETGGSEKSDSDLKEGSAATGPDLSTSAALFVSVDGSDSMDGSAPATALGTLQHAVNQAISGTTIYIEAGNYGAVSVSIAKSGQSGKPIVLEGYRDVPGDNPGYAHFDENTSHDPTVMPLFDAGDRVNDATAISISGKYIEVRNIQLTGYETGIQTDGSDHLLLENVVVSELGNPAGIYEGKGIILSNDYAKVHDCVVVNAGAQGFTLSGSHNIVDGVSVYADDDSTGHKSATDYYFVLLNAYHNTITNSYIERVGNLSHVGHGFTVKGSGEHNVFDGNTAVNMRGGGFVARWAGAANNIFRNGVVIGGDGILARDGATDNLFESISIADTRFGIFFLNAQEDSSNTSNIAAQSNIFKNITIKNVSHSVFYFGSYASSEALSVGNRFENIDIDSAPVLIAGDHLTQDNSLLNSVVNNVQKLSTAKSPRLTTELDFRFENNRVTNTGFSL